MVQIMQNRKAFQMFLIFTLECFVWLLGVRTMLHSRKRQNEFAFPKPTANSWGGGRLGHPRAGWQGEDSLKPEGQHSTETEDVGNADMNN